MPTAKMSKISENEASTSMQTISHQEIKMEELSCERGDEEEDKQRVAIEFVSVNESFENCETVCDTKNLLCENTTLATDPQYNYMLSSVEKSLEDNDWEKQIDGRLRTLPEIVQDIKHLRAVQKKIENNLTETHNLQHRKVMGETTETPQEHTSIETDPYHNSYSNTYTGMLKNADMLDKYETYECPYCKMLFKHKKSLNRHLSYHKGERKYECDECPRTLATKAYLTHHKKIHIKVRNISCKICEAQSPKNVDEEERNNGVDEVNESIKDEMIDVYYEEISVKSEFLDENNSRLRDIKIDRDAEENYKEIKHEQGDLEGEGESEGGQKNEQTQYIKEELDDCDDKTAIECGIFDETVEEMQNVSDKNRPESYTALQCEYLRDIQRTWSAQNGEEEVVTDISDNPFGCPGCKTRFQTKDDLDHHNRLHCTKPTLKCSFCAELFSWKPYLLQHEKTHNCKRPFVCDLCGKGFKLKVTLGAHTRTHSQDKPFECIICKKGFKHKSNLYRHEITHLDDEPFLCEICNARFKSKNGLVQHKTKYPNDHEMPRRRRGSYRVKRLYEEPI